MILKCKDLHPLQVALLHFRQRARWRENLDGCSFFTTLNGRVIVQGTCSVKVIRTREIHSRLTVSDFVVPCSHYLKCILPIPSEPNILLLTCNVCKTLSTFDITTQKCRTVFDDAEFDAVCAGPKGSILLLSASQVQKLEWNELRSELRIARTITVATTARGAAVNYVKKYGILVLADMGGICAARLDTGERLWDLTSDEDLKNTWIVGLCSDDKGRLYVADGNNMQVIVLDSKTGGA